MGVTKDILLDSGAKVANAYFRIGSVNGDNENVNGTLVAYLSRDAFLEGKDFIHIVYFSFKPDMSDGAPNFYRQGYALLKTKDGYKEADDVLEDGQTALTREDIEKIIETVEITI